MRTWISKYSKKYILCFNVSICFFISISYQKIYLCLCDKQIEDQDVVSMVQLQKGQVNKSKFDVKKYIEMEST